MKQQMYVMASVTIRSVITLELRCSPISNHGRHVP